MAHTSVVSSSLFSYDKSSKVFTSEMSTIGGFGQIYPDACDAGFTMISAKTRKEATFYVSSSERAYGEITGWTLKPTPETLRKQPQLSNVTVRVFND